MVNCGFCSNRILPYFPLLVCSSVTGVTSHISHIYKGINAMLIIRGPIKPYIFWIKIILAIFLAKTRPDKTNFSALTILTIDFDAESALFTLSCLILFFYGNGGYSLPSFAENIFGWFRGYLTPLRKKSAKQYMTSSINRWNINLPYICAQFERLLLS